MAGTMAQTKFGHGGHSLTGSAPVQIRFLWDTEQRRLSWDPWFSDGASNVSLTGFGITGEAVKAAGVILQNVAVTTSRNLVEHDQL